MLMTGRPALEREAAAERAALVPLQELQPLAVGGVRRGRRDAAPGGAIADRHDELRGVGQLLDPFLHRPAAKAVPLAGAVGRVDHRAFEHEDVELDLAGDAFFQDRLDVVAELQTRGRAARER